MELLNFLKQIPFPVLLVAVLILLVVTLVIAFQYAKHKGLEGIREQVYQLILKAEHMYKESGTGQQKLKWVVQQARGLLPKRSCDMKYLWTEDTGAGLHFWELVAIHMTLC